MNEPSHIMHDPTKTPIKPCLLLYPSDIHHIHLTFALDGTSGTNSVVYNSVHCVWQNHSLDVNLYTQGGGFVNYNVVHCGFTSERRYDFRHFCVHFSLFDSLRRVTISKLDSIICEIYYIHLGGSQLLSEAEPKMNSISTRPPSPVDALALEVFRGKCGSLTPTQKVIQVPLDLLDEPCRGYALQETKYDGIYWLLRNGQRHNNRCFCVFCRVKLNGLGSNLKMHSACHSDTRVYSQDQRNGAAFLFLIRHSVGFSTFRDPLVRIFLPQMSTATIEQLFTRAKAGVRDLIRREVEKRDVTVMIDGWCDASLRRYLGVAVAYHCKAQNKIVHRFLDLGSGIAGRHTAQQLSTFLQKVLESFGLKSPQISCICSDSAATNPAVADLMSTNWMPCCVHLLNLVVQNFVNNSPVRLGKLLKKINKLRKKTLWIDFVGRSQSRNRNIAGYCPTRWCSVSTCLDSFLSFQ